MHVPLWNHKSLQNCSLNSFLSTPHLTQIFILMQFDYQNYCCTWLETICIIHVGCRCIDRVNKSKDFIHLLVQLEILFYYIHGSRLIHQLSYYDTRPSAGSTSLWVFIDSVEHPILIHPDAWISPSHMTNVVQYKLVVTHGNLVYHQYHSDLQNFVSSKHS